MDTSCGPSNALSQLSKHAQKDTSLHHERAHFPGQTPQNAFRNGPGLDASLNSEFHRFNSNNISEFQGHNFQQQNMGQFHGQNFHGPPQKTGFRPSESLGNRPGAPQEWVSDFNGLSLHERQMGQNIGQNMGHATGQHNGPAQKADWHLQFMQKMRQQQGQAQNITNQYSQPQQNNFAASTRPQYQPMMGNLSQQPQQLQYQQKEALNSMQDNEAFSRQFDKVEQEMEQESQHEMVQDQEQDPVLHENDEKIQFAEAARQVQQSMVTGSGSQSQETAQKFQQSDFLKLMSSISAREVEISNDGAKLVTKTTGEDIRQYLSDPLKHERESEPDYHAPQHERDFSSGKYKESSNYGGFYLPGPGSGTSRSTSESEHIRSHLPDPLAHIKDGELDADLTSFQAARIVSGGQVRGDQWMEDGMWESGGGTGGFTNASVLSNEQQQLYDDYRHDDH